jgi:hypothetical protein
MRIKVFFAIAAFIFCGNSFSQGPPTAYRNPITWSIGGGMNYWQTDGDNIARIGPAAWATVDLWHGLGINAEGHSMIDTSNTPTSEFKYFVGEGGLIYTYHRWHKFRPYAKAEFGFASFGFPHKSTSKYKSDTRNTWAIGGGFEYPVAKHIWARVDYTRDRLIGLAYRNPMTMKTINPSGISIGATYHF